MSHQLAWPNFLSDLIRILVDRAVAQGAEPEDYLFDVKLSLNLLGEVGYEPAIQPVRSLLD
ncbi:hypothetical protein SAMN05216516_1027 [Izhakiella capsodis]|uniref:Uncharacterized protein n=1 Tax=Izhakiella capsodis TaxID=1367852 RepID=A0A1I4VQY6_9GAMM|nr:hypothetical protein SAMN05216516_1027 [Izhakiella capsodis]